MRCRRVISILLWAAALAAAQADRFDTASIRPSAANDGRPSIEFLPGGVRAASVTLKMLIQMAYDIRPEQLSGGPGWTDSEQYDLFAQGPEAAPERTRRRLQALLVERFHLALRAEEAGSGGYALTIGKGGPKMKQSDAATIRQLRQTGRWQLRAQAVDIPLLARFLSVHLRATVEDRTGLDGRYDFELNWTPESLPNSIASLDGLPEDSLLPAVREQLGLKLERQKVSTDRYTIERVDKPTEN